MKIWHEGLFMQNNLDSLTVKTGLRQGCLLSPFSFLLAVDWIMKQTTENRRNGIQWTPWSQLEDLDFVDDHALLSQVHQQMQETKELLNTASTQLGLNINRSKSRIIKTNTKNNVQPHHIERRATGRDRLFHIPGQYNQQKWRPRRRRQSKDTESKRKNQNKSRLT